MKNSKKLFSILLAVAMILSVCSGVMAAETAETGSITINNAVENATYTVYQILELESYNKDAGAYAYKATENWKSFVESEGIKDVYLATDDQKYVTWVNGADVVAFAEAALAYAKAEGSGIVASKEPVKATSTTVTFEELDLGYYLVDSSLGTLCSLDTTNPDIVMYEKNPTTTVSKEVKEGENWEESNDAGIGDTVEFKATITVEANDKNAGTDAGAVNYVLHDTMSAGLTYGGVTKVELVSGTATTTVDAANYTVKTTVDDGCTFEVEFAQAFLDTLKENDKLIVYYNATVNANAVIAGDGNSNNIKLVYGENNEFEATGGTITYVWEFDVFKYTMKGNAKTALAGAEFKLYADKDCKQEIAVVADDDVVEGVNVYRVATAEETGVTIVTPDSGKVMINGLDAGTYYLKEEKAPSGYNVLPGPVTVEVKGFTTNEETNESEYKIVEVGVENKTGTELPSTGGMGTTVFYMIGGIMVIGAAVMLFARKRMSAEK